MHGLTLSMILKKIKIIKLKYLKMQEKLLRKITLILKFIKNF